MCHYIKIHHFVVLFYFISAHYLCHSLIYYHLIPCACVHFLVVFLCHVSVFTSLVVCLCATCTFKHHLWSFVPGAHLSITYGLVCVCHMCMNASIVWSSTLLGGAELPLSAGTQPQWCVWVFFWCACSWVRLSTTRQVHNSALDWRAIVQ